MTSRTVTVANRLGLHARAASRFVHLASRFQALDAAVGKLVGMPVKPRMEAAFAASAGTRDLLDPVFAFDGNDATFYKSPQVGSWDSALQYEDNQLYTSLSQKFSNWDYAS